MIGWKLTSVGVAGVGSLREAGATTGVLPTCEQGAQPVALPVCRAKEVAPSGQRALPDLAPKTSCPFCHAAWAAKLLYSPAYCRVHYQVPPDREAWPENPGNGGATHSRARAGQPPGSPGWPFPARADAPPPLGARAVISPSTDTTASPPAQEQQQLTRLKPKLRWLMKERLPQREPVEAGRRATDLNVQLPGQGIKEHKNQVNDFPEEN